MGKFYLQKANMTLRSEKVSFEFVNFLQRRFVHRVNLGAFARRLRDTFEMFFLDNAGDLCYYIIYIWENSAQNRPIGGVCLTRSPSRTSRSRYPRVRRGGGARPRE